MAERILVIDNEYPDDSHAVPPCTLAGIYVPFHPVENLTAQCQRISGGEVKRVHYSELTLDMVREFKPDHIVASGCGGSRDNRWDLPYFMEEYAVEVELIRSFPEIPFLGICAGHQIIGAAFDQPTERIGTKEHKIREVGPTEIRVLKDDPIFENMPKPFTAMMAHSYIVTGLHPDFDLLAESDLTPIGAVKHRNRPLWGLQFHPEMMCESVHDGEQLLKNFFAL